MKSANEILDEGIKLLPPTDATWACPLVVYAAGGDGGSVEIENHTTAENVSIRGLENIKLLHSFLSLVIASAEGEA